jgi:hypothetical protein
MYGGESRRVPEPASSRFESFSRCHKALIERSELFSFFTPFFILRKAV